MDWISLLKPLPNSKNTQSFYRQLVILSFLYICLLCDQNLKLF